MCELTLEQAGIVEPKRSIVHIIKSQICKGYRNQKPCGMSFLIVDLPYSDFRDNGFCSELCRKNWLKKNGLEAVDRCFDDPSEFVLTGR